MRERMDRRSFIQQAVMCAVAFPVAAGPQRELTIKLKGHRILCDTGSGMLQVGTWKWSMSGRLATIVLCLDEDAGDKIVNHLEAEGFQGPVVWSDGKDSS